MSVRFARAVLLLPLLVAGAVASGCAPGIEAAQDPLTGDLRARVEQLKRDVAAAPTTAANVESRAAVLWEWTNAFALAGGMVPVNLTTVPAAVARARAAKQPLPEDSLGELDRYVRELAIKDADPSAIGPLVVSPAGPLPAASLATIEQTYTVGTLAMKEGGAVLIARQLNSDEGRMQHRDPQGENYVSIRSSRAGARWEAIEVPLAGMHGGFRAAEPMPAFRLSGASLVQGDTLTVVYGDKSGGSPGFRMQTWSTDQLLLPIYFDFEGKGDFLTPRWPAVAIEGGKVEAVTAIAPSVVLPGERFALSVRSEDRYSNRATGPKPGYRVLLAGKEVASIPAAGTPSAAALATVPDLRLEAPGRLPLRGALGGRSDRGDLEPDLGARARRLERLERADLLGRDPRPHRHGRRAGLGRQLLGLGARRQSTRLRRAQRARQLARRLRVERDAATGARELARRTVGRAARVRVDLAPRRPAATTTCSSALPIIDAWGCRRRPRCPISIAGSTAKRRTRTCWSSRTLIRPRTGPRTTPRSKSWSRSTRCTEPSSGSATSTCRTGSRWASWRRPTTIGPARATRSARPALL